MQTAPDVVSFKMEWLRNAGWGQKNALKIAESDEVDWHFAVDLRKKLDDESLAMRIIFGDRPRA